MAVINVVAKYGFFLLVVVSAGILIERLTSTKYVSENYNRTDVVYNDQSQLAYDTFESDLSHDYIKCLINSSAPFCSLSSDIRAILFPNKTSDSSKEIKRKYEMISSNYVQPHAKKVYLLLQSFTKLMQSLNVKVFLLETSMLFCMLSSAKRYSLVSGDFKLNELKVSRNVVTFGIFDKQAKILDQVDSSKVLSANFTVSKYSKLVNKTEGNVLETVHFFFYKEDMIVHVVVFYGRGSYLWHSALDVNDDKFCTLFTKEGSYDNFAIHHLNLNGTSLAEIFIPSDPRIFLLQSMSSKFLQCKNLPMYNVSFDEPSPLESEHLKKRIVIALTELKAMLLPRLVDINLWSKTLFGWHDYCDILHYTPTLKLAVAYEKFKFVHFEELISSNAHFENVTNFNTEFEYNLSCHGLHIQIVVLHKGRRTVWYNRSVDNSTKTFTYPKYKLCSTDLYGLHVNVPCDIDEIYLSESAEL